MKRAVVFIVLGVAILVVVYISQFALIKNNLRSMLQIGPQLRRHLVVFPFHSSIRHYRGRGRHEPISLKDFLGIVSIGFLNDSKIIFLSFGISVLIGLSLPVLHKELSRWVGVGLVFIPVFLILSLVMFFGSADWKLYSVVIGILSSARLLSVILSKLEDIEKDDYVMFLLLDGKTMPEIRWKYSYPQSVSSITSAIYWTFVTVVMLVVSISFLGLSNFARPSLGLYLRRIFDTPSSWNSFMKSSIIMSEVLLVILAVYLVVTGFNKIILAKFGLVFERDRSQRDRSCKRFKNEEGIYIEKLIVKAVDSGKIIVNQTEPLVLKKGEKIFVAGPSGSGKTVFCSTLVGFLKKSSLNYKGCVYINLGGEVKKVLEGQVYSNVEYIPQNPRDSFDKYTCVENQLKDLGIYNEVVESLKQNFKEVFWKGAIQSLKHPPSEINDGTLQVINFIVAIERLKKKKEGIILFDEPIASLSKENVPIVLSLVKKNLYNDKYLMLWIGHELDVIEKLGFDKVLVVKDAEEGIKFELVEDVDSVLDSMRQSAEEIRRKLLEFPVVRQGRLYEVNIKEVEFDKERKLENYNKFAVDRGEVVLIRGDNGSGKSTLLKSMIGYYRKFVRGDIIYYKEDGSKIYIVKGNRKASLRQLREIWRDMDVVFQNPDGALPRFSTVEGLIGKGNDAHAILKGLGLGEHVNKRVFQMSYGQKKRLMLARILSRKPKIIFLDEPTASLDHKNIKLIVEKIVEDKMNEESKTLFIITHDPIFDVLSGLEGKVNIIELKTRI